jgi:hypothetical protein
MFTDRHYILRGGQHGENSFSPLRLPNGINFDQRHLRRNVQPNASIDPTENVQNGFRFQANARLALIVEGPVQAGYVEIEPQEVRLGLGHGLLKELAHDRRRPTNLRKPPPHSSHTRRVRGTMTPMAMNIAQPAST